MRYGFRFLGSVFYWNGIMANDSYLFRMPSGLQPEVESLISHLQTTGTGVSKLRELAVIGKVAKGPDEFLATAKARMPEGTWAKIEKYVKGAIAENALALPLSQDIEEDEDNTDTLGSSGSPVKSLTAKEAIEKIKSGVFSKEQLENIILSEDRDSVSRAANKQLEGG